MKKIYPSIFFLTIALPSSVVAQCSSSPGTYDLIVSDSVVIPPSGPSFTWSYICGGGVLMDSAMCCTRLIHVEAGGTYEAGPSAYGFVYLKAGATFDAHGNNSFIGVAYEMGATILNYAGPMNLCSSVTFPNAGCGPTGITESQMNYRVHVYPNPNNGNMELEYSFSALEQAVLVLYDITGKEITKYPLNADAHQLIISETTIRNGIYFYKVLAGNEIIGANKIVIIK